jgi:long-chain fatty acid transport protein
MSKRWLICGLLLLLSTDVRNALAQGIMFPSAGAINRAMSGASTAAPLDALGATLWNPATMSAFTKPEIVVGGDFVYGDTFLATGVVGSGAGENRSDSGLAAAPVIGVISRPKDSTFTYGLGIYSILGRTIDFRGSESNPILTPFDPPNSFGVGPVSADLSGLQVALLMSKQVSETVSVGGGLTVNAVSLSLDPAFFATRNSNGTFPAATNSRPNWGAGFEVGVFYSDHEKWNFGASFKSEQWFETFKYNAKDEIGRARSIFSFGVAYNASQKTMIAGDVRRFEYARADLFGDSPEEGGLGWRSIWAFAAGVHHRFNEMVSAQFGYLYNQTPIPDAATIFNMQLTAINTNSISAGVTVALTNAVDIMGSAVYAFTHRNRGTILEIPGTAIQIMQELGTFSLGLRFRL